MKKTFSDGDPRSDDGRSMAVDGLLVSCWLVAVRSANRSRRETADAQSRAEYGSKLAGLGPRKPITY